MTEHHPKKQNQKHNPTKKRITLLVKLSIVTGLLYFLVKKDFLSLSATQTALGQWQKILPAFLVICLCTLMGMIRWQWLLRAQNINIPWYKTLQLNMIGIFFNLALPGAVSGDFVKAFYIGKEMKGQRSRAFGTIFFDRVAGLSALILVSAGALLLGIQSFLHTPLVQAISVIMGVGAISVLFFYGYLFFMKEHNDPLLKFLKKKEERFPKIESITRVYEGIRHYHHHRITVIKVMIISILIHLGIGWSCLNFISALGGDPIDILPLYVIVPLGLLVTAVPVAPGGIGTGNVAFHYFFDLIGSSRGADVYSLYTLANFLIGAVGGLIYFRFKSQEPLPEQVI